MLFSIRSLPHTQQSTILLVTAEYRREKGWKSVKLTSRRGAEYIVYVSVFLSSIRCNLVVISLADGICGQRPSCVLRCPLRSLTLPLDGRHEPALGKLAPAPHHKPPPNCRNFLPDGRQLFHPRGR